jgi:hypothetical protein
LNRDGIGAGRSVADAEIRQRHHRRSSHLAYFSKPAFSAADLMPL